MSNLHDPNDPRHMRIFEMMRQNHVAKDTAARVQQFNTRKVNKDELETIKRLAQRSMR